MIPRGVRYVDELLEDSRILKIRRWWMVDRNRHTWKRVRREEGGSLLAVDG
jgi:N-glycosylase/DNA lyase